MKRDKDMLNKYDYDYLFIPITGSDLVSFDSCPEDYFKYVTTNYGEGWQYLCANVLNDLKGLVWYKKVK